MKMRWSAGLLAAAVLFAAAPQTEASEAVPEDIYQWVQSTSRQNYYFNKQQIYYDVDAQKHINRDVLLVPVLKTYDSIQIQDVVSKRRWKMESTSGYGDLVGAAEYLCFHLKEQTVQVTKHQDLDSGWGVLDTMEPQKVIRIADLSDKDVDGRFYRAILRYADGHAEEILTRTQKMKGASLAEAAGSNRPSAPAKGRKAHKNPPAGHRSLAAR